MERHPPARPDPLPAYILKIVRNISLKAYWRKEAAKRNTHYTVALEEIEGCVADRKTVEGEMDARELARVLEGFLDTLTAKERVIFMRRYAYADTYADIAKRAGVSEKNVSVRLALIRQKMKPVSVSCQDNGIEFEVVSACVEGNEADIFVAVRDLEGDRIDATTDLFDSYRINTPFDCSSSCKIISYDAETKTAAFLISISQWNEQDITGKKVTFLVGEMLSNKQEYDVALPDLDAAAAPETVEPAVILGGGGRDYEEISAGFRALKPAGVLCSPVDGVDITAMGSVDGKLHIQAKYGSASETGDHGYVYFKNAGGGEIRCAANVAFSIDGERYEEYVFDLPDADLTGCELYGRFVTGGTHMTGNWSVTFPLENVSR